MPHVTEQNVRQNNSLQMMPNFSHSKSMWYSQILANMQKKESDELAEILKSRNTDEWAEEAFLAAEEVLLQRSTAPRTKPQEHKNADQRSDRTQEPKKNEAKSNTAHVVFNCVFCPTELRIPIAEGKYRCPKCQVSYQLKLISRAPAVYIIAQSDPPRPSPPPPPKKEQPKKPSANVLAAFSALELNPDSNLLEARSAYRKIIQSYHPDKVAHLGKELKQLSEIKTKELNEAISTITAFFEST